MKKRDPIQNSWQLMAFSMISCSLAYANPSDPIIMSGSASFETIDAKTLSITTSDQAVINWSDFSISEGELTQFFQPSSKSVVVNQVTSDLSSVLLGSLKANGTIFLLNPNGFLIGADASIDTSSFIASTLSANPQDLLAGNQDVLFQGTSTATITNLGSITAWDGDVYLIGYQVDNQGSIDAPNGTVAIGAAQEVLLQPTALEKIVIRPSLAKYESSSCIDNSGAISACKAELKADGNAYAMAINHTGAIDAIGIQEQNGEVYLTAGNGNNGVYGTITASNADGTGGSVQILGDHIALLNNALIDASGEMGGGTVLIGGDKSGGNPAIWNAKTTFVDQNVNVLADALMDGNGGKVITWADETTCFYGKISARGGENSGDGGFVEISGKHSLNHYGVADRNAPHGQAGVLLLDPLDITISTAADNAVNASTPFAPTGGSSNLSWATLTGSGGLGGGPTVVNAAAGSGGTGTITVLDIHGFNSPNSLTLDNTATATTGDIVLNSYFINNGTGDVIINSKNDINIDLNFQINGNLSLNTSAGNGGQLNVNVANVLFWVMCGSLDVTIDGDINIIGGGTYGFESVLSSLNNATVTTTTGNINISGGSAQMTSSGIQVLNPGASLTVNVPNGSLNVSGGTMGAGYATSDQGPMFVNVKNDIVIDTTLHSISVGMPSLLNGGNALTINASTLTMTAGEDGTGVESVNGLGGPVSINLTGDLTMNCLGSLAASFTNIAGNGVNINTPGNLIMNGSVLGPAQSWITGFNNVTANVNNLFMNGDLGMAYIQGRDAPVTINASQAVTLSNSSSIYSWNNPGNTPEPVLVIAGTDISIDATSSIYNLTDGPVTVSAVKAVTMANNSSIYTTTSTMSHLPAPVLVIAGTDVSIDATSSIYNLTPGSVTVVCDNDFPTPPFYGPGAFINYGKLYTTGGPLWVFTSRRFLNTQSGLLNAVPFVPGPIYVDSTSERWYTWYNNNSNGLPYKIFYKDKPIPTTTQLQTAVTLFNTAAYEFLQTLQNYDVFWYWRTQFQSDYDKPQYDKFHHDESLTSSDVIGEKIYHLLRKSYKEQNGKVIDLIK